MWRSLWLLCLAIAQSSAQSSSSASTSTSSANSDTTEISQSLPTSFTQSFSTITTEIPVTDFSGSQVTYQSYTGQVTRVTSVIAIGAPSNSTATASGSQSTVSSSSASLTLLSGATSTSGGSNVTSSSTTSSAAPTNTVPCNNYPELCTRKYSNITEVAAHNSAFVVKNNAASNQALPVLDQLNDGIRMLQGQTHYENDTVWNCHTSCDLLNAGKWQDYLTTVTRWVRTHPYDVVTILVGNSDFVTVDKYVPAVQNSGIEQFLYQPQYVPQRRDQWPTLGEMILSGKRVVMFMDYNANQTAYPYILDEFTHMWETPFSPQDPAFPCDTQRPPDINQTQAKDDYMYMANHNLNVAVDVSAILGDGGSTEILLPATSILNVTNGEANQYGRLGAMSANCTEQWSHPPNFLLVDYYNIGSPGPGSVFEVAARANGLTYDRACCGVGESSAPAVKSSFLALVGALMFSIFAIV